MGVELVELLSAYARLLLERVIELIINDLAGGGMRGFEGIEVAEAVVLVLSHIVKIVSTMTRYLGFVVSFKGSSSPLAYGHFRAFLLGHWP